MELCELLLSDISTHENDPLSCWAMISINIHLQTLKLNKICQIWLKYYDTFQVSCQFAVFMSAYLKGSVLMEAHAGGTKPFIFVDGDLASWLESISLMKNSASLVRGPGFNSCRKLDSFVNKD
jgi:hypothetical protein